MVRQSVHASGILIMCFLSLVLSCSDNATEPQTPSCVIVPCDSLDEFVKEMLILPSQPMYDAGCYIVGCTEFSEYISVYTLIYDVKTRSVVDTLPPGFYDVHDGRVLFASSNAIWEYSLKTQESRMLLQGYTWPTYTPIDGVINVRSIDGTHEYDIDADRVIKVIPTSNARKINDSVYAYYDKGFWLKNIHSGIVAEVNAEGLPDLYVGIRLTDWDVCREDNRIAVHIKQDSYDGIYEIDISRSEAVKIVGATDGAYTPRYDGNMGILYVRSCQPKHESYIMRYDKRQKEEKAVMSINKDSTETIICYTEE